MTSAALKKELHKAIDHIEDESFLKAVFTIVNEKKNQFDLSAQEWKEVENIRKQHKSGKSKSYSWEEVKTYAKGKLKK
jgi:hypothetical protein